MLVPSLLRQTLPTARIGFFLHIPFPSSEIFRCLHVRKEILQGLLGAGESSSDHPDHPFFWLAFPLTDLIGFQTYSFSRHFLMTASRILGIESTPTGFLLDHSSVSVGIFPIGNRCTLCHVLPLWALRILIYTSLGINFAALNEKRSLPDVYEMVASLTQKYAGMKVLIGRDKNDYVKGVRQKLVAYERFLHLHPEWVGQACKISGSREEGT